MNHILSYLYLNHNEYFRRIEETDEANDARNNIERAKQRLKRSLTRSQKRELMRIADEYGRFCGETAASAFAAGYSLRKLLAVSAHDPT